MLNNHSTRPATPLSLLPLVSLLAVISCGRKNKAAPPSSTDPVLTEPTAPPTIPSTLPTAQPAAPSQNAAASPPAPPPLPARPDVRVDEPPAPSAGLAATPETATAISGDGGRMQAWLEEGFRCRAISTVRFRKCRFEAVDGGHRLRFNKKDVICNDVSFDSDGNPETLLDCRSSWLRIPKNNPLKADKSGNIWSGSTSGWRWQDGEKYCCPGLWLEAPASLRKGDAT